MKSPSESKEHELCSRPWEFPSSALAWAGTFAVRVPPESASETLPFRFPRCLRTSAHRFPVRRRSLSPSGRLRVKFPSCRGGRPVPRNAKLVPPSPWRIGSASGPANLWVFFSNTPAFLFVRAISLSRAPSLHGHYSASSLLRAPPSPSRFLRLPGISSYTKYLVPLSFSAGEKGFSSCLACPCHRAVANHPAKV